MNAGKLRKKHPVWSVYNEYKTARLNVRYYERALWKWKRRNLWIEGILAVATSSVVAGLWLWSSFVGGWVWKIIITIAAVFAVLKPVVKLTEKIEKRSEVLVSYRILDGEFQKLVMEIEQYNKYSASLRERFMALMNMKKDIASREPMDKIDKKLKSKCVEIVNKELPNEAFHIPEYELSLLPKLPKIPKPGTGKSVSPLKFPPFHWPGMKPPGLPRSKPGLRIPWQPAFKHKPNAFTTFRNGITHSNRPSIEPDEPWFAR